MKALETLDERRRPHACANTQGYEREGFIPALQLV